MSESRAKFNEYILNKYLNRSPKILLQLKRINHSDYVYEVQEVQNLWELWSYQQTKVDGLEQALNKIAQWEFHPVGYEVDFGSRGVSDFYRGLAEKALRGKHE